MADALSRRPDSNNIIAGGLIFFAKIDSSLRDVSENTTLMRNYLTLRRGMPNLRCKATCGPRTCGDVNLHDTPCRYRSMSIDGASEDIYHQRTPGPMMSIDVHAEGFQIDRTHRRHFTHLQRLHPLIHQSCSGK